MASLGSSGRVFSYFFVRRKDMSSPLAEQVDLKSSWSNVESSEATFVHAPFGRNKTALSWVEGECLSPLHKR